MNVRIAGIAVVALAAVAGIGTYALGSAPKQLENMKGSVSYQNGTAPVTPIGLNATVDLPDQDYTITGPASLAQLTMPDSSQVLMGASTKVQLASFSQTDVANAKFVIYAGKTRFIVRHPNGAHANYTFQTATGTVGVRGTQGDIEYDANGAMRVNVYELCDKNYPVQVTAGGKTLTVIAGQSLSAQVVNGILQSSVQQITQQLINQFSPDFGVPTSWDAAKGQIVSYAQNKAVSAVGNAGGGIAGGAVSQAVGGLGGLLGSHKQAPAATAAPAAKSTSCG
jgi:ferric-dicitrate binding protein FerR (iron transport regulator)